MKKIMVTGGAGFIGSALIWGLNNLGCENIIVVDHLGCDDKWKNLRNLKFLDYLEKDVFLERVLKNDICDIDLIFHMGACSSTQEQDASYLASNNFEYSKLLTLFSIKNNIRFLYASSAATYGDGFHGYNDTVLDGLKPLNMYGYSKQMFDLWLMRNHLLDKVLGFKFFNVFGPNEYHKKDMRSLINKAYYQIKKEGKIKLFKSYKDEYEDGGQKRDFIYIKDVIKMVLFFLEKPNITGIFNVGTGNASTWECLAKYIFEAMDLKTNIEYIDMPDGLKDKYQYFTQANMEKLFGLGYNQNKMLTLKDAILDYIKNYLSKEEYL